MINALSVDMEEYFQVSGLEQYVNRHDWGTMPSRIDWCTNRVLELLAHNNTRATFFIVGWIAEHHPALVRTVAAAGHEIACHSYWHRLVYNLMPEEFREDTERARAAIEDACGVRVIGYRAPSYSITYESRWALEILLDLGFEFDSSIYPVAHDRYGWPGQSRFLSEARRTERGILWEFPPSSYPVFQRAVPVAGGGYLRMLPYKYSKWALEYINQEEQMAGCVYFHPWEIDPDQPRLGGGSTAWLRHNFGVAAMEEKIKRLITDFEFAPIGVVLRNSGVLQHTSEDEYSAQEKA